MTWLLTRSGVHTPLHWAAKSSPCTRKPPATPATPCRGPGLRLPAITAPPAPPLTVPLSWNPSRPPAPGPWALFPPRPLRGPSSSSSTETLVRSESLPEGQGPWPASAPQRLFRLRASTPAPFQEDLHLPTQRSPRGSAELVESTLHRKPHVTSVNSTGCTPWLQTGWACPSLDPKAQPVLALLPKEYFPCLTTSPQTILELLPDPSAAGRMMDASKA